MIPPPMRVATWNVNSIRARKERLLRWLEAQQPDVLCLQELKTADEQFPWEDVRQHGYHAVVSGEATYNGVAILSRQEPRDVERGLSDQVGDPQARLVAATLDGVRVLCAYAPNGGLVGSDKWAYKLAWLKRLRAHLERRHRLDEPLVVCGDLNVAPEERDVKHPRTWESTVLFHPEARAALGEVVAWGLTDAFRLHHPQPGLYTWWDYRMLAFPRDNGLRIDHVLVTAPLLPRCVSSRIDRDERKGQQPSDHAPVLLELGDPGAPGT
jgi:exodeoxyribonuclease III